MYKLKITKKKKHIDMSKVPNYDEKIKKFTPLIKTIPFSGGLMVSSQSASEDLILNFSPETIDSPKFSFSKFACLRLPDFNTDEPLSNGMKLNAISGNYKQYKDDLNTDINTKFSEFIQNYILNFETGLINLPSYDNRLTSTVFERVFWHSLINMGAIRLEESPYSPNETTNLYREESNNPEYYNSVVKYIGEVNFQGISDNQFSTYQKCYLHIPDNVGTSKVLFRTHFDNNYNPSLIVERLNDGIDNKIIYGWDTETIHPNNLSLLSKYDNSTKFDDFPDSPSSYSSNLSQSGFYGFKQNLNFPYSKLSEEENNSVLFYGTNNLNTDLGYSEFPYDFWVGSWEYDKNIGNWWFSNNKPINSYVIDGSFTDENIGLKTEHFAIYEGDISRLGNLNDGFSTNNLLRFKRTNIDGLEIDWNLENYNLGEDEEFKTFSDISKTNNSTSFEFNTVLLYYDIFTKVDEKGKPINPTTNLFGILFLDNVKTINTATGLSRIKPFYKERANDREDKNGTEYGLKLNFRVDTNTSSSAINRINIINESDTMGLSMYLELFEKMIETSKIFSEQEFKFLSLNKQIQNVLELQNNFKDISNFEVRLSELEKTLKTDKETALLKNLGQIYEKYLEVSDQLKDIMNNKTSIQTVLDTGNLKTGKRLYTENTDNGILIDSNSGFYGYSDNYILKISNFEQRLQNTSLGNWWELKIRLTDFNTYYRFEDRNWDLNQFTNIGNNIKIYVVGDWNIGQRLKIYLHNKIIVPKGFLIDIYCNKNNKKGKYEKVSTIDSFGEHGLELHCREIKNEIPKIIIDKI